MALQIKSLTDIGETNYWVYIRNFEAERWPAGSPHFQSPFEGFYGDVDNSPTKSFLLENKDNPAYAHRFEIAFLKRPQEELYNLETDPFQLKNLAIQEKYSATKKELKQELFNYLQKTGDPRIEDRSPWDYYPFYWDTYYKRAELPINKRDTIENGILR